MLIYILGQRRLATSFTEYQYSDIQNLTAKTKREKPLSARSNFHHICRISQVPETAKNKKNVNDYISFHIKSTFGKCVAAMVGKKRESIAANGDKRCT
jgi:hypothetical protein